MLISRRDKPLKLYIFMGESNWKGDLRRIVNRAKGIFENTRAQNIPDYSAYSPVPVSEEPDMVQPDDAEQQGDEEPHGNIATDMHDLQFTVEERPPALLTILLAFQHYISMFIATLTVPFLLAPAICMDEDNVGKSYVIGTLFVASGLITFLQNLIGIRLPIVQAGTFALLAPTLAYFNLPQWKCPDNIGPPKSISTDILVNETLTSYSNQSYIEVGSPEHREIWMTRLREVQGSLMVAALFELFAGVTGVVGFLLRYIGPLSICPTVSLLGLSLFKAVGQYGEKQWWICILTLVLMVVFSQYLGRFSVPCFTYARSQGCVKQRYPVFKMFPVILAVSIGWIVCYILTVTNVFPNDKDAWGYGARTDIKLSVIQQAPWFRVPYPGQWGAPTVSIACVCGLLSGILATTVESVGDYHACAKLSGAPAPPHHAINRGITIEGLGSFIDGILGTGNGTTSTSINVGVIGITKVGSRVVVMVSACFMIILGIFNKFGALFVTVPDPVIAGSFIILFGMIVAVGISNLQYVDLNSGRNLFIIGFSFLVGLSIPEWTKANPHAIKTGSPIVDSVLSVLLSTNMFVGGFCGFFLDNTIPGTPEERGMSHWNKMRALQGDEQCTQDLLKRLRAVYDLPFGMRWIRRVKFFRYFPICPTYGMPPDSDEENVFVPAETTEERAKLDVTTI